LPFVDNDGVNIYYEVEGEGSPLMLHHGLTSSHNTFKRNGYTEKLRKNYRLILIDARGHGKSDKPHDSNEYELRNIVSDTIAVLDELGEERSHFLGYSMGGSVGLGIGIYSPDRFKSLIIGGMGMAETDSEEEINRRKMFIDVFREGNEATVAWFERMYVLSPELREELMGNDPEALVACWSVREHVGFEDRLPLVELPCLFYAGDKDYLYERSKKTAEMIPNSKFVSLPGLDHSGAIEHSELVLPYVLKFLASIS
jgi:pimeloyl-ACP methyl ester carboxylesterase